MMNRVLLTGAGFSRNWGGWLASEITCELLDKINNAPLSAITAESYRQLESSDSNYETILQEFQKVYANNPTDTTLQFVTYIEQSIRECFFEMDKLYEGKDPRINNDANYNVERFIAYFDYFFTTNQDLLIERRFSNLFQPMIYQGTDRPNRGGIALPGAVGVPTIFQQSVQTTRDLTINVPDEHIDSSAIPSNLLPYIKLHGSYNWQTTSGNRLMISGGNKEGQIDGSPLLKSYFDFFSQAIQRPDTIIVTIGYGFNDKHINKTMLAAFERGAKLYIIDPNGLKAIQNRFVSSGPNNLQEGEASFAISRFETGLIAALQGKLLGLSQRTLQEIFTDTNQAKSLFRKLFRA